MDRGQMLNVMRQGYAARVRGDVDGILTIFTQDAKFKLNAAPAQQIVAHATAGVSGMRNALTELVGAFEFQTCDIVDAVVEGSKASIRYRAVAADRQCRGYRLGRSGRIPRRESGVLYAIFRHCDCGPADGAVLTHFPNRSAIQFATTSGNSPLLARRLASRISVTLTEFESGLSAFSNAASSARLGENSSTAS